MLQCVTVLIRSLPHVHVRLCVCVMQCVAVCCSMLQSVAECCGAHEISCLYVCVCVELYCMCGSAVQCVLKCVAVCVVACSSVL